MPAGMVDFWNGFLEITMGTSRKLHAKLWKMASPLKLPTGPQRGNAEMPSIEKFIQDGLDPIHAVYAFVHQIMSFFSEGVSELPEMDKFADLVAKAEEEYLPSGPPMSPLTTSYFTTWASYDLRFAGTDSICKCLIEANDVVRMNPDQLDALQKLAASRMGIYEHVGIEGAHIRLRELVTDTEFICHNASGYRGRVGELWYIRLLPPLLPDLARYHIGFTTPYILVGANKADWTAYLKKQFFGTSGAQKALHDLMKYGLTINHWNEFIFQAYHHHQIDAIFLAGLPDVKGSRPHASESGIP